MLLLLLLLLLLLMLPLVMELLLLLFCADVARNNGACCSRPACAPAATPLIRNCFKSQTVRLKIQENETFTSENGD